MTTNTTKIDLLKRGTKVLIETAEKDLIGRIYNFKDGKYEVILSTPIMESGRVNYHYFVETSKVIELNR